MGQPSYSLGVVSSKIGEIDLGSITAVDIRMNTAVTPVYAGINDNSKLQPTSYKVLKPHGILSITSDEFGPIVNVFNRMINSLKTGVVESDVFSCVYLSSNILLIPQFSLAVDAKNWSNLTINPIVKTIDLANFISQTSVYQKMPERAHTSDTGKLCFEARLDNRLVQTLTIDVKCNYDLIFDELNNNSIIDCVLQSFYVELDIGLIDFSNVSIPSSFNLNFSLIDGSNFVLPIYDAIVYHSGFKSSLDYNTWHVKIVGRL